MAKIDIPDEVNTDYNGRGNPLLSIILKAITVAFVILLMYLLPTKISTNRIHLLTVKETDFYVSVIFTVLALAMASFLLVMHIRSRNRFCIGSTVKNTFYTEKKMDELAGAIKSFNMDHSPQTEALIHKLETKMLQVKDITKLNRLLKKTGYTPTT